MAKNLTLQMDAFGAQALREYASGFGGSVSDVLRLAARYYLSDADGGRLVWRVPQLSLQPNGNSVAFDLEVDPQTWQALQDEAQLQGIDVGPLATHAILYFIADWDSGRLSERLRDSLKGDLSEDDS